MATSRIADSVGRVLGERYRLTRPLGVGASAHVFAAEDVRLRRRVAIKVLHPALASEEAIKSRGGKSPGSVSKKTTALVLGADPGAAKVAKATEAGVPVIDEAAFEQLLQTGELP